MRIPFFGRAQRNAEPSKATDDDLLAAIRADLQALGAVFGDAPSETSTGPAECARFDVTAALAGSAGLGVALALEVLRDGVTVRLVNDADEILDHVYCPQRVAPYTLAVFAEPGAALTLRVGHITPASAAVVHQAAGFAFPHAALAPVRLAPQRDLGDVAHWPADPFAEPGVEDAAGRLRDRVFRNLRRPAEISWLRDLRVWLEPGDEQSHCLLKWGLYEPESLALMERHLTPGGVAVDVGANCGLFTLVAARAVGPLGRVIALEPSPREFARLQANVALNDFRQVICHAAAATASPGPVMLRIAEPPFGGHNTLAGEFSYEAVKLAELCETPGETLDALLQDEARCDLIKLDVEGAELHALRGADSTLSRLRPKLLLEINPGALAGHGTRSTEISAWLAERGYDIYGIDGRSGELVEYSPDDTRTVNIFATPRT